jgi:hypothetical protein
MRVKRIIEALSVLDLGSALGEYQIVQGDGLHGSRGIADRPIGADEEGALSVGVALFNDHAVPRQVAMVAANT